MPTEKKLTGYPSIDKPWLKYYSEEAINAVTPKCSVYQNIYDSNKEHLSDVALLFFGKKITYKTLFDNIEKTAKALSVYGVKNGDNVALCMPATPETLYVILALNKLGANANMLNPTFTEEQLTDRMNDTGAELLFVVNELYSRVKNVIPKTTVKKVISCAAVNSLGPIVKCIKKVKNIPDTVSWNSFIKSGKKVTINQWDYEPNHPAIMVYSSGTTGASKGIQLTNDSLNATITQYKYAGFEMSRNDRYFAQIPVWFSTGIAVTIIVPLCLGVTVILEPLYKFDLLADHIAKYKPNFMVTAVGLLDYLRVEKKYNATYKEFKYLVVGGEYVVPHAEKQFNEWLKENGNKSLLHKGYGMCELGGTVTTTFPPINDLGSAGIPMPQVVVSAFDLETGKELKYGERGELRVLYPCRMREYYKNPEATEQYFHKDEQGHIWACTGDMGYVAEDGSVYVDGRLSASYVNDDGETVYLFDIERAVLEIEQIRQCKVVVSEISGRKTHIAHIVLIAEVDTKEILGRVKEHCANKLPISHRLTWVKVYDSALPVAPSGKLDVAGMEKNTSGLIDLR